ncbi:MAG: hypothetical protein LIR50_16725 [Bacillota bacterium]|nr:hypothetical protein [Bacillota bacterium]
MNDRKKFLLYAVIPLIILLMLSASPVFINLFGKSFSLKGQIIRAENNQNTVFINYAISETENKFFKGEQQINSYMYVCLEEKDGYCLIKDIKDKKPSEGIYLKGRVNYYSSEYKPDTESNRVNIYYDIQNYFLSKGEKDIKNGDNVKVNLKFFLGKTIVRSIEKVD